jgi:acyl phosphate:glycerol-3-phosphate acyltransferase
MHPIIPLVLSYLLGSIPAAYMAGKARGIDLRQHGSGNLGATNVFRVLGARIGAAVMLFDMAKGALPVFLFPAWTATAQPQMWAIAFGIAAILGHVRPVFLLWRGGGKGVATAGGVFLALAPVAMLLALGVWLSVLAAFRFVSLASLSAAAVLAVAVPLTQPDGLRSPLTPVALLVAVFVFWMHRSNIERLRRGEEHRFGRKVTP